MALVWNRRRALIWSLHILVLAPLIYFTRNNPEALTYIVLAMAAYHAYRLMAVHQCKDPYSELNIFHIVFVLPLVLLFKDQPRFVAVLSVLMAGYFTSKFALYSACQAKQP